MLKLSLCLTNKNSLNVCGVMVVQIHILINLCSMQRLVWPASCTDC